MPSIYIPFRKTSGESMINNCLIQVAKGYSDMKTFQLITCICLYKCIFIFQIANTLMFKTAKIRDRVVLVYGRTFIHKDIISVLTQFAYIPA